MGEGHRSRAGGSQRPHLDDVNVRGILRFRGHLQLTKVLAGDDEDDGGGAECHLLLGSVPLAARPGHDDGPDGALDRSERPFFEAALQPREPGAEQLQQAVPELWWEQKSRLLLAQHCLEKQLFQAISTGKSCFF